MKAYRNDATAEMKRPNEKIQEEAPKRLKLIPRMYYKPKEIDINVRTYSFEDFVNMKQPETSFNILRTLLRETKRCIDIGRDQNVYLDLYNELERISAQKQQNETDILSIKTKAEGLGIKIPPKYIVKDKTIDDFHEFLADQMEDKMKIRRLFR